MAPAMKMCVKKTPIYLLFPNIKIIFIAGKQPKEEFNPLKF